MTWKTLANPAVSNICKTFCQHCCLLKTCESESFQAPVYLVTEKNILKSHGPLQLGSMLLFSISVSRFADRDLHSIRVLSNTTKTEGMLHQELSASTMLQFDLWDVASARTSKRQKTQSRKRFIVKTCKNEQTSKIWGFALGCVQLLATKWVQIQESSVKQ